MVCNFDTIPKKILAANTLRILTIFIIIHMLWILVPLTYKPCKWSVYKLLRRLVSMDDICMTFLIEYIQNWSMISKTILFLYHLFQYLVSQVALKCKMVCFSHIHLRLDNFPFWKYFKIQEKSNYSIKIKYLKELTQNFDKPHFGLVSNVYF